MLDSISGNTQLLPEMKKQTFKVWVDYKRWRRERVSAEFPPSLPNLYSSQHKSEFQADSITRESKLLVNSDLICSNEISLFLHFGGIQSTKWLNSERKHLFNISPHADLFQYCILLRDEQLCKVQKKKTRNAFPPPPGNVSAFQDSRSSLSLIFGVHSHWESNLFIQVFFFSLKKKLLFIHSLIETTLKKKKKALQSFLLNFISYLILQ